MTRQNLDWFWQRWFFDNGYIDVGIASVKRAGDKTEVVLDNVGGMPAPVTLVVTYTDGSADSLRQTSAIWKTDARRAVITLPARKPMQSVALEGGIWMDADAANDRWTAR